MPSHTRHSFCAKQAYLCLSVSVQRNSIPQGVMPIEMPCYYHQMRASGVLRKPRRSLTAAVHVPLGGIARWTVATVAGHFARR